MQFYGIWWSCAVKDVQEEIQVSIENLSVYGIWISLNHVYGIGLEFKCLIAIFGLGFVPALIE